MKIRLRYGHGWCEAQSPPGISWMRVSTSARDGNREGPADDARGAERLQDRLLGPETGPGLDTRLRGIRRIGIVVPDRTRSAALDRLLPALFDFLARHEDRLRHRVALLAGGGAHLPDDPENLRGFVPPSWRSRVDLFAHDARAKKTLRRVGKTSAGTPVDLNRVLLEQDLVIAVGAIGFHYFAGFSGGRKAIFPGLASLEGTRANHRLVLHPDPGAGLHPACRPGNLDGNPVHLDMLQAAKMLDPEPFLVNALLDADDGLEEVVTGELETAHARGCAHYLRRHRARLPDQADLVVADAGGHPRDIDLVQAHKSLLHLSPLVRDGGVVILAARCAEGVGSPTLLRWFAHPDGRSMEAALRADYMLNAHTALSLRLRTERFRLLLVTEIPAALLSGTGIEPCPTFAEALRRARDMLAGELRGACIHSPTHHIWSTGPGTPGSAGPSTLPAPRSS